MNLLLSSEVSTSSGRFILFTLAMWEFSKNINWVRLESLFIMKIEPNATTDIPRIIHTWTLKGQRSFCNAVYGAWNYQQSLSCSMRWKPHTFASQLVEITQTTDDLNFVVDNHLKCKSYSSIFSNLMHKKYKFQEDNQYPIEFPFSPGYRGMYILPNLSQTYRNFSQLHYASPKRHFYKPIFEKPYLDP